MTQRDLLDEAVRAYRAAHDGRGADVAAERAELLARHRSRRGQRTAWLAAAALLTLSLGLPTAWALTFGPLGRGSVEPGTSVPVHPVPVPATSVPEPSVPGPETSELFVRAPERSDPLALASTPPALAAPRRAIAVDPAERRAYDAAHALHFEARDAAAAITAWDAYLAAYPRGRFATEARYNRALALVRLGRRDEAIAALQPFARGDHGRYRRREAASLLEALGAPR